MKQIVASLVFSCLTMFAWGQSEVFNIDDYFAYTTCDAIMHDDNGGLVPYSANANNQITLYPGPGETQVNLYFVGFSVSVGDVLAIYDGPSSNSPLIGVYDQADLLFETISPSASNASGSITISFTSNGDNNVGDFSAYVFCGIPCDFPIAVMEGNELNTAPADTVKICPGESVEFDATGSSWTAGAAPTYFWDFGDATTATTTSAQGSISHVYAQPGGYRARLRIEDSNDCQSLSDPMVVVLVSTPYNFDLSSSRSTICLGNTVLVGSPEFTDSASPDFTGESVNGTSQTWVESNTVEFENALLIPDNQGCLEVEVVNTQFGSNVIEDLSDINSISITMEHSYVGDITVRVICPNGQTMSIFPEAGGSGIFLGEPIDNTSGLPGIGYDYSFSPNSTGGTWMEFITTGVGTIPAGDYEPEGSFNDLIGCPMNGTWTLEICDIVGADDGYVFAFGIQFGAQYYPEALQFTPSVGEDCNSSYWVNASLFSSIGENCDWAVFNPTAPGSYTLEYQVVNDFGCVFTDDITVLVTPSPQVSVNDIDAFCNSPQELVAVIQNGAPGTPYAYNWSPSTGLSSPVIASPDVIALNETTTYTVTVTQIGIENCVGTAQATVTVLEGGCADSFACNYDPNVACDNGTCFYPGCDDVNACNFNPQAGCNDGSCVFVGTSCDDGLSYTYDDVITPNCGCFGTVYNYGGVMSTSATWCPGDAVNPLMCTEPSNLNNYAVQWYYTDGSVNCPFVSSTDGWMPLAGANSLVFTPSEFSGSRTFACFITPTQSDAIPGWADNCVYYTYHDFTAQTIIGNPNIIPFSNYTYAVSQIAGNSFFWSVTNGAIISGQGTNAIQVFWGANGPYDVILTEGNGICESTTSLFNTTSVVEIQDGLIQVWPNPTSDKLQIEVAPQWLGSSWRITNVLGQEVARPVLSQTITTIETSQWAEGIYLLQNESTGFNMKILKK